jgi:hypothetical protein
MITLILLDCPTAQILYLPHEARVDVSVRDYRTEAWYTASLTADEFRRFARRVADVTGAWKTAKRTIRDLSNKIRNLKTTITYAKDRNEERNRQLDALGMVWCDGGCQNGMARYGDLCFAPSGEGKVTAEHIAALIHNAGRAWSWYVNREYKRALFDESAVLTARARVLAAIPPAYRWLIPWAPWHGGGLCEGTGEDAIE